MHLTAAMHKVFALLKLDNWNPVTPGRSQVSLVSIV